MRLWAELLAGVNSRVMLYRWIETENDGVKELSQECGHAGHILALYVEVRQTRGHACCMRHSTPGMARGPPRLILPRVSQVGEGLRLAAPRDVAASAPGPGLTPATFFRNAGSARCTL